MALPKLVVRERDIDDTAGPRVLGWSEVVGREGGGLVVLVILFGALALASQSFLTGGNMANLSRQWAVYGIIAIGELLVILTKGIDLSVGSVVGLSGAVAAQLLVRICPAHVYTEEADGSVGFTAAACLECGTCLAVAPEGALSWHYPRGGFGVAFRQG